MHPSVCALRRIHLPLQGRLWGDCRLKGSPVRGCGVERRLRRRKLFLIRQTAVTPFIIACSAIESIGPPFAHRSGLCRFAASRQRRGRRMQACFSMRRMMRVPQTGNVGASRLRGAAPCLANTLPGWLGCGGRVRGGRNRPPYIAPVGGRQHKISSRTSGPTVGRRRDHPFAQGPAACRSRFDLPFALHCRAGVYARRGGWRRRTGFCGQTVRGRLTISGGDAKKLCEEGPLMLGNCE